MNFILCLWRKGGGRSQLDANVETTPPLSISIRCNSTIAIDDSGGANWRGVARTQVKATPRSAVWPRPLGS